MTDCTYSFKVAVYFFDAVSSRYTAVHVWAYDVDIKDGATLFTEEMMMESMFDIVP